MDASYFSEITPYMVELANRVQTSDYTSDDLFIKHDVKRGLRDSNGKGVLTGLTEVSDVSAYRIIDNEQIAADGKLYYQGYDVSVLIQGMKNRRFGFEEVVYLLLFAQSSALSSQRLTKQNFQLRLNWMYFLMLCGRCRTYRADSLETL